MFCATDTLTCIYFQQTAFKKLSLKATNSQNMYVIVQRNNIMYD